MFLSRRDMLQRSGTGFGLLGLAGVLAQADELSAANLSAHNTSPLTPRAPHFTPRAQRVVHLFMNGGPSQVDTFDPKPEMKHYAGKLLPENLRAFDLAQINTANSKVLPPVFSFNRHGESGLEISELFPKLGQHDDKLAVIRSCYHELFIHGSALTIMHSGTQLLGHPSD